MNSALGRIFDALLGAINLFRFWIVLDAFEQGIILRLGKYHKSLGPGFHWRRAFRIDVLLWLNVRKKSSDSWEMCLTSSDGKNITISFDIIIEVFDVTKALLTVDDWVKVSYTSSKIILSKIVENSTSEVIMNNNFSSIVHSALDVALEEFGVTVTHFGITDKAYTRSFRLFNGPNS